MQRNLNTISEYLGIEEDFSLLLGDLQSDSRQIVKGDVFVATKGQCLDGRNYIDVAIQNGAAAIIYENNDGFNFVSENVKSFGVSNLSQKLPKLAAKFYGEPSKKIHLIGITGTNGKSSITYYIAQLLNIIGKKCGIIGTVGNGFIDDLKPTPNTTPGPIELQKELLRQIDLGAEYIAMEVSSHGIAQGRIDGLYFDRTAFTNLSRDHLDFHKTMEAYFAVKKDFILKNQNKIAVLNGDDEWIKKGLLPEISTNTSWTVGRNSRFGIDNFSAQGDGTSFDLSDEGITKRIDVHLIGAFNIYNAVMAYAIVRSYSDDLATLQNGLTKLKPLKGRMELFTNREAPLCVVDYAHTPDGLEKALTGARSHTKGRMICVVGCGGDRDRGKRPMMASMADKLSDYVIFTDDNPRTEDPQQIIDDMLSVKLNNAYEVIHDRAEAIKKAIYLARSEDTVVIAGKGHEDYQIIGKVKHHFSDQEVVKEALKL